MSIYSVSSAGGANCRADTSNYSVTDDHAPPGIAQQDWDDAKREERLELIQESIRMEGQCGGLPKQEAYTPRPYQVRPEPATDGFFVFNRTPGERPWSPIRLGPASDPDESRAYQGTLEAVHVFGHRDSQREERLPFTALALHPAQFEPHGKVPDNANSAAYFDKKGILPVTARQIPETGKHPWMEQEFWRELSTRARGALYGFGESVAHGLYDTALFFGRGVVQIGDIFTGFANHDHPYMQELWKEQKAIGDSLIYSIRHPIQTAYSLIQAGKERYHAALAEEDPFAQSRGVGNIAGAVWQAILSVATAAPSVAKAGVVGAEIAASKAFTGPLAGSRTAQRGMVNVAEALEILKAAKPTRVTNPKHHPNSISPEPKNVDVLYENSIPAINGVRWAKDEHGDLHRFSKPSNGETHWNGSTTGVDPIKSQDIPSEIKNALEYKKKG